MKGDKKESGSNSELIVDKIPRLVAGLLVDTALKQKKSLSASQNSPKVRLIGNWSNSRLRLDSLFLR